MTNPEIAALFNKLKIAKFNFTVNTLSDAVLPDYKGSTFRGAFGHIFKDVMCIVHHGICEKCDFITVCMFKKVFDSPAPPNSSKLRNYSSLPHPYIIEPPPGNKNMYAENEKIGFSLILVGSAISLYPYFAYAFGLAGLKGLGRKKNAKFEIIKIVNEKNGAEVYDNRSNILKPLDEFYTINDFLYKKDIFLNEEPGKLSGDELNNTALINLNFITPAKIMFNEKLVSKLEFHIFIRNLLRRISNLNFFYCSGNESNSKDGCSPGGMDNTPELDFNYYIEKALKVKTENMLKWYSYDRYSNRQHKHIKFSGFTGNVSFLNVPLEFLWIINLGELIHIGKNTTFGLGKYIVESMI